VIASSLAAGSRLIGAPVPVWLPTLGVVANMMLVLPLFILGLNFFGTLSGKFGAVAGSLTLRFIGLSILGFFAAAILGLLFVLKPFAEVVQFTLIERLRDSLTFYACFSTAMFGAAYFYLPRLTGKVWRSSALTGIHFGATALGIVALFIGLAGAGCKQGHLLADASVSFATITSGLAGWHAFNSVALGLLLVGHVAFFLNFAWISCPINSRGTAAAQIPVPPVMTLAGGEGHA